MYKRQVTDEETQVQTFDNLADDYICKPFSLILLLKRICLLYTSMDIMMGAPATVEQKQLDDVHIAIKMPKIGRAHV